jgi:phosphoribosylglycinamide formyltransferase-1
MMPKDFYLVIESSWFTYCYLVEKWIESFEKEPSFKGILATEKAQPEVIRLEMQSFHREYAGRKQLNDDMEKSLKKLYPGFGETEKAMIRLFGIPKYSTTHYAKTSFLSDVNGEHARQWLTTVCKKDSPPYFFIGIGKILKSWWIEISDSQIINAHSAVLPYARGIYSIENIAATKDIKKFRQSVGATVHYVDAGVDTGSIIRAKRIINPFSFNSIWELKGYTYMTGFKLLADVAKDIISNQETIPVGISHDPNLRGPNFKQADFTLHKHKQAEEGYLSMKLQNKEH